ncbi:MAG: ADP-ribosylation factor-like protein [Candidatus Kariarchaeaceae archaeon]
MSGQPIKLVFTGLDQAGKTTIYKMTMEEMSLPEAIDPTPTRGIERHSNIYLDTEFQVWDLGGQKKYRETYLTKPEIFDKARCVIYVVDIQDFHRIDESYKFYVNTLNIIKDIKPQPRMYVLFHKFDPEKSVKLKTQFYRATKLFRKADQVIQHNFKGYATSIHSNTIDLAIKRILFENFEAYEEPEIIEPEPTPVKIEVVAEAEPAPVEEVIAPTIEPEVMEATESETVVETIEADSVAEAETIPPEPAPLPEKAPPPTTEPITPTPTPTKAPTPKPSQKPEVAAPPGMAQLPSVAPVEEFAKPVVKTTPDLSEIEDLLAMADDLKERFDPSDIDESEVDEALEMATPTELSDLSEDLLDKLASIIDTRMKETEEIVALSILGPDGKQVLAFGETEEDYGRLDTVREVVSSLNPKQFFKDLTDIEYRGLGHVSLDLFDIYFARASDDYAVAVIATNVSTEMLENAQIIVNSIRQGLNITPDDEEEEVIEEEEEIKAAHFDEEKPVSFRPKGKKDLVLDLRSRLDKMKD